MTITDDVRKTLADPTPLYAVAGAADLAREKLKEVAPLVEKLREQAPERIEAVRSADPKVVQERVSKRAKETQSRVNEALSGLDTDIKKLREQAQDLALQSVGRAAEYAVRARETYDELAERGRGAVKEWRGEATEEVEVTAEFIRPQPEPAVESTPPAKESATDTKAGAAATKPASASKPAAKKTATTAKKATAKKTAPKKTTPKSGA